MNLVTNLKKTVVAVALGALAFAGVAGATVSSAAETTSTPVSGNIDVTQKGTINIHKFENPAAQPAPAGTGTTAKIADETKPVAGVVFTYQKVNDVDLTTNAGWDKAAKLQVKVEGENVTVVDKDNEATTHALADEASFTATDTDGLASKDQLPLGVYLIKEKSAPNSVLKKAAPFLVTVPYPNTTDSKATTPWLYTVDVYPKNTVLKNEERPHKALDATDPATKGIHFPEDAISWTITQTIPKLAEGETLKSYVFEDTLPATVKPILEADKATKVLVGVTKADQPVDPAPTATIAVDEAKGKVTVSFTGDELAKLKTGQVVKIQLRTELKTDAEIKALDAKLQSVSNRSTTTINGQKYNSVPPGFTEFGTDKDPDLPKYNDPNDPDYNPKHDPNNPAFDPKDPGYNPDTLPGATVKEIGELKIHKENAEHQPLKGAEFKVASKPENGTCDEAAFTANTYEHTLTTDEHGDVSLKVVSGDYCVKETKAPVGYVIAPNAAIHTQAITVTKDTAGTVTIENQKKPTSDLPALPVTGASGFIILLLGGSAVIALAVGTGFVATSRRKRNS